ncbi:galactose-3-O-sulfotransferase 4-like [Limulus polyphemus]|uniref:Galactose-3-O-sulfotransferase 4-like n=1 Tax=Limulus polyphemus TaxID=6850 RepID=A0ABM1AZW3_LIMPO|nr:galactose-3-O-sulfotransferase 4-like [Limulus polyphemus]
MNEVGHGRCHPTRVPLWKLDQTNWPSFTSLFELDPAIVCLPSVDDCVVAVSDSIVQAAACFIPKTSTCFPWIPEEIATLLDEDVQDNCLEAKTNVVFLKTHKAASSSIQNIFMRYGDTHDLLFVLPYYGNYFGHPQQFHHSMAPRLKPSAGKTHYNIFTHHTRFNYGELKRLMPKNTIFVTILRDPAELFESLYSYYSLENLYNESILTIGFNTSKKVLDRRYGGKIGRNQMSFDLGLSPSRFFNVITIEQFAQKLDKEFDLVMIAEQMDKSLILLKNLLCWSIDDVVIFKLNARSDKFVKPITADIRQRLQEINSADQVLYNFFKKRLAEKIHEFGKRKIVASVKKLKKRRQEWFNYCVQGENLLINTEEAKKVYYANPKVMKLKPKEDNVTCKKMTDQELYYTNKLRKKQKLWVM